MSKRPPRPLWPLLTAALIGLPVLYVLSQGPAVCFYAAMGYPDWLYRVMLCAYGPLDHFVETYLPYEARLQLGEYYGWWVQLGGQ